MKLLALYIGVCLLGILAGNIYRKKGVQPGWTGMVQMVLLVVLLFTMGAKLFANREVVESIGEIGISAFVLTAGAMAGSLAAVTAVRRILGFGRKGERADD